MADKNNFEKISKEVIASSIWEATPVSAEPETTLTNWRIYQVQRVEGEEKDTIHFVGWTGYEGRVSSRIEAFDDSKMTGISKSGRVYKLKGKAGFDPDASYVWQMWLRLNGNLKFIDITDSYNRGGEV